MSPLTSTNELEEKKALFFNKIPIDTVAHIRPVNGKLSMWITKHSGTNLISRLQQIDIFNFQILLALSVNVECQQLFKSTPKTSRS